MPSEESELGPEWIRSLVAELHSHGFQVVRPPSAETEPAGTPPDILAGNGDDIYAINVSATDTDKVAFGATAVENLGAFARQFGAKARLGVLFPDSSWVFVHPRDVASQETDEYYLEQSTAEAIGYTVSEL